MRDCTHESCCSGTETLGVGITMVYTAFGMINLSAYGEDTQTVLIENLTSKAPKTTVEALQSQLVPLA